MNDIFRRNELPLHSPHTSLDKRASDVVVFSFCCKFIAVNVESIEMLRKSVAKIDLDTYTDLQTAGIDTSVIDVIHMIVKCNISGLDFVNAWIPV